MPTGGSVGENSTELLWLELIHVVIASSFVEVKKKDVKDLH